jgi:hypothetical protein
MKVYKTYRFNLGVQMPFKETLPYIENMLNSLGILYSGIAFSFKYGKIDAVLKEYPNLKKYHRAEIRNNETIHTISSVRVRSGEKTLIHANLEDEETIRQISAKIPRPYNFLDVELVIDNIAWYKDISFDDVFFDDDIDLSYYFSNSVHLIKSYNFGTKYNIVDVSIELIHTYDKIIDDSEIVKMLSTYLGTSIYNNITIRYNSEEKKKYAESERIIEGLIDIFNNRVKNFSVFTKSMNQGSADSLTNQIMQAANPAGISSAKILKLLCKTHGYQYRYGYGGGYYSCCMINENGHIFGIEHTQKPGTRWININLFMRGLEFSYKIQMGDIVPKTQNDLKIMLEYAFEMAKNMQRNFAAKLLNCYGKTPKWYSEIFLNSN